NTTTTVASSSASNTSNVNDSVTFTATVSAPAGAAVPLSGSVAFKDNGNSIANCTAVAVGNWNIETGQATAICTTSALIGGNHTVVATFGSDSNYNSSNNNLTQTVNAVATTTTAGATPSSVSLNESVTLNATVTPNGQPVALTGPVSFTENNQPIPGCTISWNASAGTASCSTTQLTRGSHMITATYPSDASYTTSSAQATVTVNAVSTTMGLSSSAQNS